MKNKAPNRPTRATIHEISKLKPKPRLEVIPAIRKATTDTAPTNNA